jgi:Zn-dependent protease
MTNLDVTDFIAIFLVIFLAIGIHEYAHAKLADMAGDPTPGIYGRVTLNLFKHFDPIGTIMIIITTLSGFGIGWGKPVPMDPRKMRNPKWDHFVAVIGGPVSNFIQAMLFAVLYRLLGNQEIEFLTTFLLFGVLINVSLGLFNLLPIGPLDGMWILGTFLPDRARIKWTQFNLQFGGFLFLGLIILGQTGAFPLFNMVLGPARRVVTRFMLGAEQ